MDPLGLGAEVFALLPLASVELRGADLATIQDWEANGLPKITLM